MSHAQKIGTNAQTIGTYGQKIDSYAGMIGSCPHWMGTCAQTTGFLKNVPSAEALHAIEETKLHGSPPAALPLPGISSSPRCPNCIFVYISMSRLLQHPLTHSRCPGTALRLSLSGDSAERPVSVSGVSVALFMICGAEAPGSRTLVLCCVPSWRSVPQWLQ